MTLKIIAGKYKGRLLCTPKAKTTRPTQGMLREAVFNICQMHVEGARVLDLYAGSGAMGFEALSRGASHVTFIERDRGAALCIKKNIEVLSVADQATLIPLDAKAALKRLSGAFDLIYIDPPYDISPLPILEELLLRSLLSEGAILFLEERFTPQKTSKPLSLPQLTLVSQRRFGTALLHQYTRSSSSV